ncbi:hypothetical protein KSF73_03330 [Burkholderiaceae bacterium DAT-1]|nr:hypothetical protein [Burkholderiaceae bacterium DAT-1]
MLFYTSITANYLPKARVLAHSVKKHHPDSEFVLLLSDDLPANFVLADEPFDEVLYAESLGLPNFESWVFKHSVVELCTAVKGPALEQLLQRAEKVVYLDPDMAVFSPLTEVEAKLDQHSIVLTPHQTVPEEDIAAIRDNEICSLKHGVFNLGFLAVRRSDEGLRFAKWWSDRLQQFCYADIPGGLFTDQRWVDLAPCFFADLHVLRHPGYNVATWNLSHRQVKGDFQYGFTVNEAPLVVYHFSGFDSGAQEVMLNVYGKGNPALHALRNWYIAECDGYGQAALGKLPCKYGVFSNGEKVSAAHRFTYRSRPDLIAYFASPMDASNVNASYFHWFAQEYGSNGAALDAQGQDVAQLRKELSDIYQSRSWRLAKAISNLARKLKLV